MKLLQDSKCLHINLSDYIFLGLSNALILIYFLSSIFWPNVFHLFTFEDHLIEWSQFGLYLLSSIFAFLALKKISWPFLNQLALLFMALSLFLIAMEEVSWGQRIFHFQIEFIQNKNLQNETNIHNLFNLKNNILVYIFWSLFFFFVVPLFDFLLSKKKNYHSLFSDIHFIAIHFELFVFYTLFFVYQSPLSIFFYEFSELIIAIAFFKLTNSLFFLRKVPKQNKAK